jgi:hypothetical protein
VEIIMQFAFSLAGVLACVLTLCASPMGGQQKGQYQPGQFGLNAGVLPDAGITYADLNLNYNAGTLKDSNGNTIAKGSYNVWAIENIFYFVAPLKFLHAKFAAYSAAPTLANGSLTLTQLQFPVAGTGGFALGDSWIEPISLGWHLSRADVWTGYAFVAPTGRYVPGASTNVGSGYWGNDWNTGTTVYLTKNKGTTANLYTNWEVHQIKQGPNGTAVIPGQAFTDEWGFGQLLPLNKQFTKIFQLGLVGYDQYQVTANQGSVITSGIPASLVPYYSVHAIGFQTNFIMPPQNLNFFFKFEPEYSAKARVEGRTIVFGGSWTLRIPKPAPPPKP